MSINPDAHKEEQQDNDSVLNKYLEFSLGREEYAIPLLMVKEVIPTPETTEIPCSPDYFLGIMNLRGKVIHIIDLRTRLNIPPKEIGREEAVIIIDLGITVGVVVDSINKVLAFGEKDIKEVPEIETQINSDSIIGVFQKDDGITILLNIEKVLNANKVEAMAKAAKSAKAS